MTKKSILVSVSLLCAMNIHAAPLGRVDLPPTNVDIVRRPVDTAQKNSYSVEGALGFISYEWDIGSDAFRNTAICPQVAVAHSVTENFDLRAGLMFAWLSDSKTNVADEGEPESIMDPSLSVMRPSAGIRLWANRPSLFPVFLDAQLNYFIASGKDISIRSAMASVQLGAGVNYAFDERISALAEFVFETSFKDGKARFNGNDQDLSIQGTGVIIGMRYDF
jgi:opacity protein-like surface antigen